MTFHHFDASKYSKYHLVFTEVRNGMLKNLIHVKLVVYCRHPCMVSKHLVYICHQQFWVSGQSLTFSTYFAYPELEISLILR